VRFIFPVLGAGIVIVLAIFYKPEPIAKGDKQYGGTLTMSSKSEGLIFFPLADNTLEHQRVQALVFEPLLKPAQNERGWRYCLANKVSMNEGRDKITLHIRKNIHFSHNPCFRFHSSELTAEDVAFTLSLACSQQALVQQDLPLPEMIVGGRDFYQKTTDPIKKFVKGLRVIDSHTLEIHLNAPFNHFLNLLSAPNLGILSKQAFKYYGKQIVHQPIGTGPFQILKSTKRRFSFERNPNYWRHDRFGNQLPYLDRIVLNCGVPGNIAQQQFLNNKLDLLFDLPVDELQEAFGTLSDAKSGKNPLHEVYIKNAAKVHFIQFNALHPPFNNLDVRRAFALAIDGQTICNDVLKGEGSPLNNQFIPTQKSFKNTLLKPDTSPLNTKISLAKTLLNNAGFDARHPFPIVTFYVGAAKNTLAYKWSSAVAKMLRKNLGVQVVLKLTGKPKKLKSDIVIWRTGWVGDYPGAESYLRLFYSSFNSTTLFKNEEINHGYKASVLAETRSQIKAAQMRCEKAIIDQQALIPIYTEDFIVLNQLRLRGLKLQESGMLDFARLYIKDIR
jgi:ABC-type transport system substrate-binding protein